MDQGAQWRVGAGAIGFNLGRIGYPSNEIVSLLNWYDSFSFVASMLDSDDVLLFVNF
jgi:hypothetical protein